MIVDLERFVRAERPYWNELKRMLDEIERDVGYSMTIDRAQRIHYLYRRASADLARLADFPAEPRVNEDLSNLVARAYAEIHETREKPHKLRPLDWFLRTFPQTFRRHYRAFLFSLAVTLTGALLGSFLVLDDPGTKKVILPFPHLLGDPSDRVEWEESHPDDRMEGAKGSFSAMLMTHNTRVSIFTMGLGITFGIGTILMLFYNGVILGAVCIDYILAGEARFLAGWLLPHGAIEIPAIIIAGQAGFILGKTLIGRGRSDDVRSRLREAGPDLVTLIFGVALLLVWAGIVESFFSQYHEPLVPYWLKIGFGTAELLILTLFLSLSGRKNDGIISSAVSRLRRDHA